MEFQERRAHERGWYDSEGSKREFLSSDYHSMYLPYYLQSVANDSTGAKVGLAAMISLLTTASGAYGGLFFVVVACWMADMIFGTLRVMREGFKPQAERVENFRWSKAGDGLLRLVVIILIPGLLAMVGSVSTEIMASFIDVRSGFEELASVGLATFALSMLMIHELMSVLNNASSLHQGMRRVRDRLNGLTEAKEEEV